MIPTAASTWTPGVHRRVLPNGLTVLAQPDPDAPAVAVVIHVRAGFFDEPDRWQGISHVLEHMFFKGTPTRGVGQIAAEIKGLGGYLNAATAYDWTSYYVVLPATGFREALAIQADALQHASLDGAELARELRVIIEEAKRKLDTPSALAYESLHAVLFDHHRIRRWRIGTEEGLSRFTRDDLVGYYQSRYVPGRTIVSVVGAVPADLALEAVEAAFGAWPARPAALDEAPTEPERSGVRVRTLRGDVKQADLVIGWRGVSHDDPDAAALDVAAMVLSSGRGSWLYQTLRRPGLVTSVGAYHYSPSEVGVFSVVADLEPDGVTPAIEAIAGLVDRLRRDGPTAADLDRARTLYTAQMARRFESVDGRAASLAHAEAAGGVDRIDADFRARLEVTAADVTRVAARYLAPDRVGAVVHLPKERGADLAADHLAGIMAAPPRLEARSPSAPAPTAAPARRAVTRAERAGVTHVALPGVDLLLKPKTSVPMVTLGLYRRRAAAESAERAGVGTLAVRSTVRGAGDADATVLADRFESLGGSLGTSIAADWFGLGASVLAPHRDQAALLLRDVLWRPRFEADEIERERTTLVSEAVQVADDMFRRPIDLALGAAFGPAGYGLPVKGLPASLAALDADTVRTWHREELARGRTVAVAVGNFDVAEAAERLAAVFEDRPAASAAPRRPADRWTRRESSAEESRAKSQTALAMVFPGPARSDPDRFAAEVLAAVASGLGGRLFHALREERSLAYTVLMSSWQRVEAGALITYIATSPEREEEARSAMLAELSRFATDLVTEDELTRAVNYLAGQCLVQRQTAGAVASEIIDAWLVGTGLEEVADPAGPYRAVTREAVRAVAARYLDPAARAEGVVRGGA